MKVCVLVILAVLCAAYTVMAAERGIYGIDKTAALCKVDPKTGALTRIGPSHPEIQMAEELSAIDEKRQIFYIIGFNDTSALAEVIGFDLNSGKIIVEIPVPLAEGMIVGSGQTINVDPVDGSLYVTGTDAIVKRTKAIYKVQPWSAQPEKVTKIASFDGFYAFDSANIFDSANRMLWLQFNTNATGVKIEFVGYNVSTNQIQYRFEDKWWMSTMNYDPKSGMVIGVGLNIHGSYHMRTLLTLDSKTGNVTQIAELPGYFIIEANISAYDQKNQLLYVYLQPGYNQKVGQSSRIGQNKMQKARGMAADKELVTIDVAARQFADYASPEELAFSLEFLN